MSTGHRMIDGHVPTLAEQRERRKAYRAKHLPVGMRCEVHDGTRATVPGEVVDNTTVLIMVRLDDGRLVHKYDHEVFAPEPLAPSAVVWTVVAAGQHRGWRAECPDLALEVRKVTDGWLWEVLRVDPGNDHVGPEVLTAGTTTTWAEARVAASAAALPEASD